MSSTDSRIPDDLVTAQAAHNLLAARVEEARIAVLSEFLDLCDADEEPYKAIATLERIDIIPTSPVHPAHQLHLARSIEGVFKRVHLQDLQRAIVYARIWDSYDNSEPSDSVASSDTFPWLTDPLARQSLRRTFSAFVTELSCWDDVEAPAVLSRLRTVVKELDPEDGSVLHGSPEEYAGGL
ncbi:hypothetical protein B0H17DRAFT_1200614 [Mycena rosella]|uniref:Uncharacterized protein n=1 Tax=Mycena rosella TaxID=1033263 RepID=A0AAD7DIX3_MYCRO|nr:hypothetical protein B0H17DRAFT_1200614 [Mycena rosella]